LQPHFLGNFFGQNLANLGKSDQDSGKIKNLGISKNFRSPTAMSEKVLSEYNGNLF